MNLTDIILSRSHIGKNIQALLFHIYEVLKQIKIIIVMGFGEIDSKGVQGNLGRDRNVLYLGCDNNGYVGTDICQVNSFYI